MSRRSKTKKRKLTMAEKADKFKCYQLSVQSPDHEVEFFGQAFREVNGTSPLTLREDFCGTFAVCCSWVKSHPRRKAVGIDLCEETLQWGRDHNLKKLDPTTGNRIRLINQDVRKRNRPQVDVLAAQNFSFWIFKTRKEIIEYFRIARANMKSGGVMILDMMGGGECYTEGHIDKRTIKKGKNGFHYYWEQARFNPVTSDASFYISFRFKDGSRLKHAFEYHWRFWTIPEVREMLEEAGFKGSQVYWEQEDENGEDTGVWAIGEEAISNPSWVCYIVGQK